MMATAYHRYPEQKENSDFPRQQSCEPVQVVLLAADCLTAERSWHAGVGPLRFVLI